MWDCWPNLTRFSELLLETSFFWNLPWRTIANTGAEVYIPVGFRQRITQKSPLHLVFTASIKSDSAFQGNSLKTCQSRDFTHKGSFFSTHSWPLHAGTKFRHRIRYRALFENLAISRFFCCGLQSSEWSVNLSCICSQFKLRRIFAQKNLLSQQFILLTRTTLIHMAPHSRTACVQLLSSADVPLLRYTLFQWKAWNLSENMGTSVKTRVSIKAALFLVTYHSLQFAQSAAVAKRVRAIAYDGFQFLQPVLIPAGSFIALPDITINVGLSETTTKRSANGATTPSSVNAELEEVIANIIEDLKAPGKDNRLRTNGLKPSLSAPRRSVFPGGIRPLTATRMPMGIYIPAKPSNSDQSSTLQQPKSAKSKLAAGLRKEVHRLRTLLENGGKSRRDFSYTRTFAGLTPFQSVYIPRGYLIPLTAIQIPAAETSGKQESFDVVAANGVDLTTSTSAPVVVETSSKGLSGIIPLEITYLPDGLFIPSEMSSLPDGLPDQIFSTGTFKLVCC